MRQGKKGEAEGNSLGNHWQPFPSFSHYIGHKSGFGLLVLFFRTSTKWNRMKEIERKYNQMC